MYSSHPGVPRTLKRSYLVCPVAAKLRFPSGFSKKRPPNPWALYRKNPYTLLQNPSSLPKTRPSGVSGPPRGITSCSNPNSAVLNPSFPQNSLQNVIRAWSLETLPQYSPLRYTGTIMNTVLNCRMILQQIFLNIPLTCNGIMLAGICYQGWGGFIRAKKLYGKFDVLFHSPIYPYPKP